MKIYGVYMVQCSDDSLYTGWTTDVTARVAHHNAGLGAKYTRSRLPVVLVYWQTLPTKAAAMRQEYVIKKLPRAKKLQLIKSSESNTTPSLSTF